MENVERLGYYAKEKINGNLFQFTWDKNKFKIKTHDSSYVETNPELYEILEIGFFKG